MLDSFAPRLTTRHLLFLPLMRLAAENSRASSGVIVPCRLSEPAVPSPDPWMGSAEARSEKSKEMFFFFLCNRRPLRKEEIITALWPDLPEEKSTNAFHGNMYRLRQALYKDVIAKVISIRDFFITLFFVARGVLGREREGVRAGVMAERHIAGLELHAYRHGR